MSSATVHDIRFDDDALSELSASFRGQLVRPGGAAYAAYRRVWNGSIDRFPALIARCAGVADVMEAVRFARAAASWCRPRRGTQLSPATPSATEASLSTWGR